WTSTGEALYALGRYEEALEALEYARRLDPWSSAIWTYLGLAHTARSEYDVALEAYREETTLEPSAPEPWAAFGALLIKLEHYEEALKALDHALAQDVDPKEPATYQLRAAALHALGREGEEESDGTGEADAVSAPT